MKSSLKVFIIVFILIFLIYVFKNIKKGKLNIQNGLIWIAMSICIILCVIFIIPMKKIAIFIGAETLSNIIFFLGFIFLIFVSFNTTKTISINNKKIINLTQELAILKKDINDKNKSK